jgi:hypothetical protein
VGHLNLENNPDFVLSIDALIKKKEGTIENPKMFLNVVSIHFNLLLTSGLIFPF